MQRSTSTHRWARKKVLIVGAGLSGATIARELAEAGIRVDLIDRRNHVAANAFDETNEYGIRVHRYGPHLFHTSDIRVVNWLSQFCEWVPYKHKVKALLSDFRYVTLPVNLETKKIIGSENVQSILFRPYTKKMWGIDIEDLDSSVLARIPIRDDLNELYFPNDNFQALPRGGYTQLVKNILSHEKIRIFLNTKFDKKMLPEYEHCFNSMPIDEYFDFALGELPYRSIKFHTYTIPVPRVLPVATVNFTHEGPYTRVTEWSALPEHGESKWHTTITIEEPCDYRDNNMERYYPMKDASGENRALYRRYRAMTGPTMTFIGRCGTYAYLDMHQAVSHGLSTATRMILGEKA
jgi:UDP-galactopyranose mutase